MQQISYNISIIKKKILKYAEYKGLSAYRIYQETGITNGIFSKKGGISEDNLLKIVNKYHDINLKWLLIDNYDGPMILDEELIIEKKVKHNQQRIDQFEQTDNITDLIKLASWVTDKNKKLEEENSELKRQLNTISRKYNLPENSHSIAAEPGEE